MPKTTARKIPAKSKPKEKKASILDVFDDGVLSVILLFATHSPTVNYDEKNAYILAIVCYLYMCASFACESYAVSRFVRDSSVSYSTKEF